MKKPQNGENLPIRNSTAEFLVFAKEAGSDTIAVRFQDEMQWLTQPLICQLFDVAKSTVSEHLSNIFASGELSQAATVRKYRTVRHEGSWEVERELEYYSLEAIIAVGYRVNSRRATDFRRWATRVLRDFAIRGYVLDKERLENGKFLGEDYFDRLIEEIQAIRLSERRFYQKVTDIYATSMTCSTGRARFPRKSQKRRRLTSMRSSGFARNSNTRAILISSWIRSRSRRRRPVTESRRVESQDGI